MKDKLFDIKKINAKFRCQEDEIFYQDQKSLRKFTMGCLDKKDNLKIEQNRERKRRDRQKEQKEDTFSPEAVQPDQDEETDKNWHPPEKKRRKCDSEFKVTIDSEKWLSTVAATSDKAMASSRVSLQIAAATLSSIKEPELAEKMKLSLEVQYSEEDPSAA